MSRALPDLAAGIAAILGRLPRYGGVPGAAESSVELARACRLVVKRREAVSEVTLPCPAAVVVLDGTKTAHLAGKTAVFRRGDVLIVPQALAVDMVNDLCPKTGTFRSAVLEILPRTLDGFSRLYPKITRESLAAFPAGGLRDPEAMRLPLDETLAESLLHVFRGVARGERSGPIVEHRLYELLLAVAQTGRGGPLLTLSGEDDAGKVLRLVSLDPSRRWTADEAASRLGMSVSTLSRRLRGKGVSLRGLLDEARMRRALALVCEEKVSIAEAARACGYESPSRFSARFRERYGQSPSGARRASPGKDAAPDR